MSNVLPLVYFGNIGWWQIALQQDTIAMADKQLYERQTFRNRMQIMGPNTIQTLSVPVKKVKSAVNQNNTSIAYAEPWAKLHIRSLQAAYGKSPYYQYYIPYVEAVILGNFQNLAMLNLASFKAVHKMLKLKQEWNLGFDTPTIYDDQFEAINLAKYNQVFDNKFGFVPNLSILDLLFNCGPDARGKLEVRDSV